MCKLLAPAGARKKKHARQQPFPVQQPLTSASGMCPRNEACTISSPPPSSSHSHSPQVWNEFGAHLAAGAGDEDLLLAWRNFSCAQVTTSLWEFCHATAVIATRCCRRCCYRRRCTATRRPGCLRQRAAHCFDWTPTLRWLPKVTGLGNTAGQHTHAVFRPTLRCSRLCVDSFLKWIEFLVPFGSKTKTR